MIVVIDATPAVHRSCLEERKKKKEEEESLLPPTSSSCLVAWAGPNRSGGSSAVMTRRLALPIYDMHISFFNLPASRHYLRTYHTLPSLKSTTFIYLIDMNNYCTRALYIARLYTYVLCSLVMSLRLFSLLGEYGPSAMHPNEGRPLGASKCLRTIVSSL